MSKSIPKAIDSGELIQPALAVVAADRFPQLAASMANTINFA